jgi:hypothetical protein
MKIPDSQKLFTHKVFIEEMPKNLLEMEMHTVPQAFCQEGN